MLRSLLFLGLLLLVLPIAACDSGEPTSNEVRRVYITEVEISNAPLLQENGDDWDGGTLGIGDEPDIYFELVNDDTGSIVRTTEGDEFSNVDSQDFPLVWADAPGGNDQPLDEIEFTRFTSPLAFDLWDEDPTTDDDFMGSSGAFTIQQVLDMSVTPPTLFTIPSSDGISVRIRLRYES